MIVKEIKNINHKISLFYYPSLNSRESQMGCSQSSSLVQVASPHQGGHQSAVGILRIALVNAIVTNYDSMMSNMDPYVLVRMGTQRHQSPIVKDVRKGGQIIFNQSFRFIINASSSAFGRVLEIQIWDKYRIGKNQVGFGIIDLNKLVRSRLAEMSGTPNATNTNLFKQQIRYKCWINRESEPAGYINIIASFEQLPFQTVHFRFDTAIIRKKTRVVGNMDCLVSVIIGQEQLFTSRSQDTKQRPPSWLQQADILKFRIPKSQTLKSLKCKIILMDVDKIAGQIQVPINDLLALENGKQNKFVQDCYLQQQQTASLRYSIIRGQTAVFQKKQMMGSKIVRKQPNEGQKKKQQVIITTNKNTAASMDPNNNTKIDDKKAQNNTKPITNNKTDTNMKPEQKDQQKQVKKIEQNSISKPEVNTINANIVKVQPNSNKINQTINKQANKQKQKITKQASNKQIPIQVNKQIGRQINKQVNRQQNKTIAQQHKQVPAKEEPTKEEPVKEQQKNPNNNNINNKQPIQKMNTQVNYQGNDNKQIVNNSKRQDDKQGSRQASKQEHKQVTKQIQKPAQKQEIKYPQIEHNIIDKNISSNLKNGDSTKNEGDHTRKQGTQQNTGKPSLPEQNDGNLGQTS